MKAHPQTAISQLTDRYGEVWRAHKNDCQLQVGHIPPISKVTEGKVCVVMVARPPLMHFDYFPVHQTQLFFDMYGS